MYVSPPCVMIPLFLIPTVWDNSVITLTEGRALDFSLALSGSAAAAAELILLTDRYNPVKIFLMQIQIFLHLVEVAVGWSAV